MKRWIFYLLFIPVCIFSEEHMVPLGTQGNKLALKVKNTYSHGLKDVRIFVHTHPDWVTFHNRIASIDTLPAGGSETADLIFDVANGEAGLMDTVLVLVWTMDNILHAVHKYVFRTIVTSGQTEVLSAYPNPANPSTMIPYVLKEPGYVKIEILNILGQHVRTLVEGFKPAGQWEVLWDSRDSRGIVSSTGIYIIRLQKEESGQRIQMAKKLLLTK